MTYDIETRELPEQTILSIRDLVPPVGLPTFIGRSFEDLFGHIRLLSVAVTGEPFAIYHSFGADAIDAEIGLPVADGVIATGRISTRVLPATTVAETVHAGPYEGLTDAYTALTTWVADQGFEAIGPVRERYLDGPGTGVAPSAYRTIVAIPIALAPVVMS